MQQFCKAAGWPNFRSLRTLLLVSVAMPCIWVAGTAQEQPSSISSATLSRRPDRRDGIAPSFRTDVQRVFVPVTVTDAGGHKVEGLRKEDFRISQDGVAQTITEFFVDEAPVSVEIVLDASNSMRDRIDPARQALSTLLRMSSPQDEFSLITVQDQPQLAYPFTTHVAEIEHEMAGIWAQGWTALYDGMALGINNAKKAHGGNRVLLVLSDGGDNNSRYTDSEMKSMVRESDVRIFSISLFERCPSIEKLARESGGMAFHVRKLDELPDVASSLSAFIHGEYVLGFSPTALTRDGKYHVTKVEVVPPAGGTRLHASWRHGYYAPVQ